MGRLRLFIGGVELTSIERLLGLPEKEEIKIKNRTRYYLTRWKVWAENVHDLDGQSKDDAHIFFMALKELPEEDQEILFQVQCDMMGGDLYGMYKGTYRDGTFWIDEYDHKSHIGAPVDAVLAWMPAPETYRGEA